MIGQGEFVHLHLHSHYSFPDGMLKIRNLVSKVKSCGMSAVALTDYGNMFGSYEFYQECRTQGIKPIIGQEFYVTKGSGLDKSEGNDGKREGYHLVLLAKNEVGLKNLIELSSMGFLEGSHHIPRIDKKTLEEKSEGLIVLSGCVHGEIPSLYLKGKEKEAKSAAEWYKEFFDEDFYLELQYHGLKEQEKVNRFLIKLSKELDIELVATNNVHYLNKEDWETYCIFLHLRKGKELFKKQEKSFIKELYLKDAQEMYRVFKETPQALYNTLKIAEKVESERFFKYGNSLLPKYPVPKRYTSISFLERLSKEGLKRRFKQRGIVDKKRKEKYYERLRHELRVINDLRLADYFLIVWDLINWTKRKEIPIGPGSGSVAGSLVAYAIGITNIDPLEFGLLFECFLNTEETTIPNIAISIGRGNKDRAIQHLKRKYGKDKVYQPIVFSTTKAKFVIREIGEVLKISPEKIDRFVKFVPNNVKSIENVVERTPKIKEFIEKDEVIVKLLKTALKLQGLLRDTRIYETIYTTRVIVTPDTLIGYIPLAKDKDGRIVTQYDIDQLSTMGIPGIDLFELRILTVINKTLNLIKKKRGIRIDLDNIPLDDEKTFKILQEGNTFGVFQLESQGMINLIKRLNPSTFKDIVNLVSLYRPGPLSSGIVESYIRRKHGLEPVNYVFPELKTYLEDTYGLFLYREQIMQAANTIAGYSLAEANILCQIIEKEGEKKIEERRNVFVKKAVENGYSGEKAEKLFNNLVSSVKHSFRKFNAVVYGFIAYISAYLKANYPEEFSINLDVKYSR